MPRWKRWSLLGGVALTVVGAVWMLLEPAAGGTGGTGGGRSGFDTGLVPEGPRPEGRAPRADTGQEPAARGVFRLGFSFVAGFCIGAFLRATLKVAAIAIGFGLLMTFVLSYFDLVEVNWQGIDDVWSRFTANVAAEWGDFQRFVTGSLPAAGLALAGLGVGLKRH
jgi:uncharacterized membrane protein (Fun14 family)